MSDLLIEKAQPKHTYDIWRIIRASFNDPQSAYSAIGQPGYVSYLHDFLAKENTGPKYIIVGMHHGQVAAFADITVGHDNRNFLTRIAVKPHFRGLGIARLLMSQIQHTYGQNNSWELDVFHINVGARLMYESIGFEVITTSRWVGRFLAKTADPNGENGTFVLEDPRYSRYGFTNIDVQGKNVSIAGKAVRCHDVEHFLDDSFLTKVQERVPKVDRVFIVLDDSDNRIPKFKDTFEIDRSDRMSGIF